MSDIEKRARELLAAEYEKGQFRAYGPEIRSGGAGSTWDEEVRAIIAALTPPEGYVLVPVELPVDMEVAFMEAWVGKRRCVDDPEMQDAWAAALAARPEVQP